MLREILIFMSSGGVVYVWLCAVVAPAVSALKAFAGRAASGKRWAALGLTMGSAFVWTAVPAAAIFLFMMCEPRAGLALVYSPTHEMAMVTAAVLWFLRSAALGLPRLAENLEIAVVVAVVALVRDDPEVLGKTEALYRELVITSPVATRRRSITDFVASGFRLSAKRFGETRRSLGVGG